MDSAVVLRRYQHRLRRLLRASTRPGGDLGRLAHCSRRLARRPDNRRRCSLYRPLAAIALRTVGRASRRSPTERNHFWLSEAPAGAICGRLPEDSHETTQRIYDPRTTRP